MPGVRRALRAFILRPLCKIVTTADLARARLQNNSFAYPNVSGYSFSFTEDGYFEQAQFTWNSNATDPHCIEAVVLWQHGTYEVNSDGSITTDPTPFKGDGRIQVRLGECFARRRFAVEACQTDSKN